MGWLLPQCAKQVAYVVFSAMYRVTRASGSDPAVKKKGGTPPHPSLDPSRGNPCLSLPNAFLPYGAPSSPDENRPNYHWKTRSYVFFLLLIIFALIAYRLCLLPLALVCGIRLFDTGPRIFGGFVYSGVSYYVSRHYSVYASECGAAPPRGSR